MVHNGVNVSVSQEARHITELSVQFMGLIDQELASNSFVQVT